MSNADIFNLASAQVITSGTQYCFYCVTCQHLYRLNLRAKPTRPTNPTDTSVYNHGSGARYMNTYNETNFVSCLVSLLVKQP